MIPNFSNPPSTPTSGEKRGRGRGRNRGRGRGRGSANNEASPTPLSMLQQMSNTGMVGFQMQQSPGPLNFGDMISPNSPGVFNFQNGMSPQQSPIPQDVKPFIGKPVIPTSPSVPASPRGGGRGRGRGRGRGSSSGARSTSGTPIKEEIKSEPMSAAELVSCCFFLLFFLGFFVYLLYR